MVNNPYPERSDAVIEELANRLHADYLAHNGIPLNFPVPVEEIAEQFLGYEIDFSETGIFSDPDILGGIDFDKNKIYVNASVADHDGRYSFTVAHELGHHVLHRDHYLQSQSADDEKILCRMTGTKPQIEMEADRFAAALLIPSDHVSKAAAERVRKVRTIGQARALANDLITNSGFSNVSNSAMINRLKDLDLLPSAIPYQGTKTRRTYGPPSTLTSLKKLISKYRRMILRNLKF